MSEATRIVEWTRPIFDVYEDDGLPPSRDIYYAWHEDDPNPWLLHYCLMKDRPRNEYNPAWVWAGTGLHTLVSRHPLHLEPSIGWMTCCGSHGFIRGGQWIAAGDEGWMP